MLQLTNTARKLNEAGYKNVPGYGTIKNRLYSGELPMFEKRGKCWSADESQLDSIASVLRLRKRNDQVSA